MFNPTPVAEWNALDYQGAPYAHIAPVPYTDGPFTTAVGPDGIIVNAQQPMTLYPNEWSAMAQGGIPHDCPRPTARKTRRCANEPRRIVAHAAWRSVTSMRKRTFKACVCSRNAAISAAMSGGGRSGNGGLNRAADRPFRKTA